MSWGKKATATTDVSTLGIDVSLEPTNQETTPLAYVAGQYVVPASWGGPAYNQRAVSIGSSGKGGSKGGSSSGKSYNYYASMLAFWHVGQCDKLTGIIIDDRLQWYGEITRPTNGAIYTDITIDGRGVYRHYWGTNNQLTVDPILQAAGNDYGDDHPAYNGICYGVFIDFLLGQNRTTFPTVKIRGERTPVQAIYNGTEAANDDGQANAFAILAECHTNPFFGLGQSTAFLATTKWQNQIKDAYNNRKSFSFCSPYIDQQQTLKSFATDIFALCDGFYRSEAGTGLIEVGAFTKPENIDAASLLTLDSQALVGEGAELTPESWDDIKNTWTVSFRDRDYVMKTNSVRDSDINGIDVVGEVRNEQVQCKAIVRAWQAQNYATEYKRRHSTPGCDGTIKVRAELVEDVQPGQHIRTDIDAEPGGIELQQVFRVKSITRDVKGTASLTLEAERTLSPMAYIQAIGQAVPPPEVITPDVMYARFFEAPPVLGGDNFVVGLLASRPDQQTTGYSVYYDKSSGGYFPQVASGRAFALRARLNADLASTATGSVSVELLDNTSRELIASDPGDAAARNDDLLMVVLKIGISGQIQADANNKAWIEVFSCQSFTTTAANIVSVTALRNRQGTPARDFALHDEVWFIRREDLTMVEHADFSTLGTANAYFKIQPTGIRGERPLESCAMWTFSFALNRDLPASDGSYLETRYTSSLTMPATPTGDNPSGWTTYGPDSNLPIWAVQAYKSTSTGHLVTNWTSPVRQSGSIVIYAATAPTYTWLRDDDMWIDTTVGHFSKTYRYKTGSWTLNDSAFEVIGDTTFLKKGLIQSAAIGDAQIISLTADKLTAGTVNVLLQLNAARLNAARTTTSSRYNHEGYPDVDLPSSSALFGNASGTWTVGDGIVIPLVVVYPYSWNSTAGFYYDRYGRGHTIFEITYSATCAFSAGDAVGMEVVFSNDGESTWGTCSQSDYYVSHPTASGLGHYVFDSTDTEPPPRKTFGLRFWKSAGGNPGITSCRMSIKWSNL